MDTLIAHPLALLLLAWLGSRLQILIEVRTRMGVAFRPVAYGRLRWPQMLHSAVWTLLAYGVLVAMDEASPAAIVLAGVAADQVVDRVTGKVERSRRPDVDAGEAHSDITTIERELRRDET